MKTQEQIKEFLENEISNNQLLTIYNEYAEQNYYDTIYDMDDFDEIMDNTAPSDIASKIFYGDFRPNDYYFTFDGCGKLKSSDYPTDFIDYTDLANYIFDNDDDLGDDDLRDFLDEEDDE